MLNYIKWELLNELKAKKYVLLFVAAIFFINIVTDPEGIHARPAGMLVKAVKEFSCDIKIAKDGKAMNCKAIFGIMGLAVKQGEEVTLTFYGADEDAAYEAISNFMKENL